MEGFLDHVRRAYTDTDAGFFVEALEMKLSDADPEARRIVGWWGNDHPHEGEPFVINARPVGGRNAGTFQGWVTLSRAEYRRVTAPRPSGWHSYTCMVGYAPDDETIWWSEVYDDDLLAKATFEEMEDGRWLRLPPEDAAAARVASANMLQQTLGFAVEEPPAIPSLAETTYDVIQSGLSLALDPESAKHLSGDQIQSVIRRALRVASYLQETWVPTRQAQSYSRQKAAAHK